MQWNEKLTFFYLTQPQGPFDGLFYKIGGDTKGQQAEKRLAQPKSTYLKLNKNCWFVWVFKQQRSMEFHSTSHTSDFLCCPVQSQELDSVIFVSPFQLRIFYDLQT